MDEAVSSFDAVKILKLKRRVAASLMDFKVILQPLALDDLEAMSHTSGCKTATRGADHEQEHEHD